TCDRFRRQRTDQNICKRSAESVGRNCKSTSGRQLATATTIFLSFDRTRLIIVEMKIHDPFGGPHYVANDNRYSQIPYRRCGRSGVLLPVISIGLWHNFGHTDNTEVGRKILRTCFDNGITHFDLANNYGPPFGAAEENFGRWMKSDFLRYRDEMLI